MANLVKALVIGRHFDGFKTINGKRVRYRYRKGEIVEVSMNNLAKSDGLKAPNLVAAEAAVALEAKAALEIAESNQEANIQALADASAGDDDDKEQTEKLEEAAAEVVTAVDEGEQEAQETQTAEEEDTTGEAAEASEAA